MMNLRYFLILSTSLFFSCKEKNKEVEAPIKPNILFVLVDDLGIKDLGFTGSTYYETPNIDNLASKSTIFTQGYAGSRVCSPSRATLMTGKFTARHGITDWIGAKTGEDWRDTKRQDKMMPANYVWSLPKEDTTIAESMKANGYKTFFAGKWHLGEEGSYPEDHGFDINIGGFESGSPRGGYFSPFKNPKLENKQDGENLSMRLAKETSNFINQNKETPFFAFLSFYAVHGPIQTNQQKWEKYRDKAENQGIQENGFKMERKLPIRQIQDNPIYGGLVESMDDAVGIVLNQLKESGLDKNTIVIFTSDNGGVSSGDNFSTSNLPFKGGKGYQWEGGIREPYLIYIPWSTSKQKTIEYPVTGADFYPTLLDYANINLIPNQHQDGISLKPILEANQTPKERPLYWHYPHYGNQGGDPSSIIRKGDWKLIHYYEDDSNELYNLKNDPYEQQNIATQNQETTTELYTQLKNWLVSVDAKYPEKDPEFDSEKRANYEKMIREKRFVNLEKERKKMLSKDFSPNKDWWGSKVTKE
ncbi:sulfatase [Polaribacter litorisediminis]|uniref:sulfatase n=1 Tax=Polaribacter litorisediminis TaxID=1908341 RepID=UPI001CC1222F|nr:sulfatase [Polaribacter litorisediminis]UAM97981.1 sulfatase [Polaribacter litorisediminis]